MITNTTEKRFEMDIADYMLSPASEHTANRDAYDPLMGLLPVNKEDSVDLDGKLLLGYYKL